MPHTNSIHENVPHNISISPDDATLKSEGDHLDDNGPHAELISFLEEFFRSMLLQVTVTDASSFSADSEVSDLGLRSLLKGEAAANSKVKWSDGTFPALPGDLIARHSICMVRDAFFCRYIILPVEPGEVSRVIVAGPYIESAPDVQLMARICSRLDIPTRMMGQLNQFYATLPIVADSNSVVHLLETAGRMLYGDENFDILPLTHDAAPHMTFTDSFGEPDPGVSERIEKRYEIQDAAMKAIADGDIDRALGAFEAVHAQYRVNRIGNVIRNRKNMLIVVNTTCRIAAQRGGLSPYYLDRISSKFAIRIENTPDVAQLDALQRQMVREYCMAVKSFSTSGYSPVVASALNYITMNLADDISLASVAEHCAVNKNYMSTVFHRETGVTVMEMINRKRIEYAVQLFNLQRGSVQDVAAMVGIPNTTWFGRLFRRYMNMAPTEYVKMLR